MTTCAPEPPTTTGTRGCCDRYCSSCWTASCGTACAGAACGAAAGVSAAFDAAAIGSPGNTITAAAATATNATTRPSAAGVRTSVPMSRIARPNSVVMGYLACEPERMNKATIATYDPTHSRQIVFSTTNDA